MSESILKREPPNRLRVHLVGISGTSRDILLSVFMLKSFALQDEELARSVTIETGHYKYILPSHLDASCAQIAGEITQTQPDLVGFSTYTWNYDAVIRTAGLIRESNPKTEILLGGPEVAACDVIAGKFNSLPIDYLICGEGEIPFVRLLKCLASKSQIGLSKIARLAYRSKERFLCLDMKEPKADILPSLSDYPLPYRRGIVPEALLSQPDIQANIETQRGCNFRCAYCLYHANFPAIRYHSAPEVVDEIESLYKCGVKHFRITDANFLSKKDFALAILRALVLKKVQMSFFVEIIPSFMDAEIAHLLEEYRNISVDNRILVGIGLQTINADSLRAIRRSLPIEHFTRAFELLAKVRAIIKTDIILGLPYETKATYLDLMEYIADKMRNGYNFLALSLLRVLPGTELDQIATDAGIVVERDSEHFVYETPTMCRQDLLYCLRISAVAFRFFYTLDDPGRLSIRNRYFEIRDRLRVSHLMLLAHFLTFFQAYLAEAESDYVKVDFPRAEHYWYFDVHKEIPDQAISEELDRLSRDGFPE